MACLLCTHAVGCMRVCAGVPRLLDCHQGSHEGEGLQQEDDHHKEEQKMYLLKEVEHVLAISIDDNRYGRDDAGLQHKEGVKRDEAEHRQLAEERRQHRRHHRRHVVLEVVLDLLEGDGDRDQHGHDRDSRLQVKEGGVAVNAVPAACLAGVLVLHRRIRSQPICQEHGANQQCGHA